MSKTFRHVCIKPECTNSYEDTDPDAYYCDACREHKKALAKELDKKLASRQQRPHKSALQEYDEAPKVNGFVHVKF